jgi:ATPase subunit of ABC transporter with duplicated ATPase domains
MLQSSPTVVVTLTHCVEMRNARSAFACPFVCVCVCVCVGCLLKQVASEKIRMMQKAYEAQTAQRAHIQKFIDRFRFNAKRASMAQSRIKTLEKMMIISPIVEEDAVYLPFPNPEPLAPPILQFMDVSFGYGSEPLFRYVELDRTLEYNR